MPPERSKYIAVCQCLWWFKRTTFGIQYDLKTL